METYILVALIIMLFAILGLVLWLWRSDRKENRKNLAMLNEKLSSLDEASEKSLGVLASHGERLSSLDEASEKSLGVLASHGERLSHLDEFTEGVLSVLVSYDERLSSLDVASGKGLGVLASHGERLSSLDEASEKSLGVLASHDLRLSSLDEATEGVLSVLASHDLRLSNLEESTKETLTMVGSIDSSRSHVKGSQEGKSASDQVLPANTFDSLQYGMPSVWVDRKQFLRSQLGPYDYTYDNQLLRDILRDGPPQAGINFEEIDKLADDCIEDFVRKVHRVSSGTRSPDSYNIDKKADEDAKVISNLTMVFVQKLAHLYGIYDLLHSKGIDQSTQDEISERISELLQLFVVDKREDLIGKGEDYLERNADTIAENAVEIAKRWGRNIFRKLLKRTSRDSVVKMAGKSVVPIARGIVATTGSAVVAEIGTAVISRSIKFIVGYARRKKIKKKAGELKDLFREIARDNLG